MQGQTQQQKLITISGNTSQKIDIDGQILEIIPLGSGSEVGRSCVVMKFFGKTIMFDCGIHPAYTGLGSLPYFDEIEPSKVDILLMTHFHLDHCGSLPYFLEKTDFQGECYMTHPTKAIYKLILSDYVKVSHVNTEESLYEERDLIRSLQKIKLIDYHQEINCKDVKFWAYNAGHVLGAAMFLVEIQGIRVLYTGDFSREIDRHLKPAEIPKIDVHILIIEATYGIHKHEPRETREVDFKRYVSEVVKRGGRCLLPVFAVGRAQELLLILDEFWDENKDLAEIPIYYASSLASSCIDIFKTYINMTGDYTKKKFYTEKINPFNFKHIKCVKTIDYLDDNKPAVVFASPGMLQSGLSRNLFEKWCENSSNGIVITGYCVEGTLARYLLGEPNEVKMSDGRTTQLKMTVKNVTFSAHSDFSHTSEFIEILQPKNIVLVHGDGKEMERLRNELERNKEDVEKFRINKPKIFNPKNCHKIEFFFKIQKHSDVVGKLSNRILNGIRVFLENPKNNRIYNKSNSISQLPDTETVVSMGLMSNTDSMNQLEEEDDENFIECTGILLEKENLILETSDLEDFSTIKLNRFKQILTIPFTQCKSAFIILLGNFFSNIIQQTNNQYLVEDAIKLYLHNETIVLEWYACPKFDIFADSIAVLAYQIQAHPNSEIFQHYMSQDSFCKYKMQNCLNFLKAKYDDVELLEGRVIQITQDAKICQLEYETGNIYGEDQALLKSIGNSLEFFKSL